MGDLTLIRHGKTQWTEEKRFSGWGNAPLSDTGREEALSAGQILKKTGHVFDICFTSTLIRAQETAQIIFNELDLPMDKLRSHWQLNERHYGALQGHLRKDMTTKHGGPNIFKWRNNYHAQPPELTDDDPRWQEQVERLPDIPIAQQPRSESMKQAVARTQDFWHEEISPAIKSGKKVLIVAHTNSIRSLVRSIEDLNDAQSAAFRIPTAIPRYYELDKDLKPYKIQDVTNNPIAKAQQWVIRGKMEAMKTLSFINKSI